MLNITHETFTGCIGQKFTVQLDVTPLEINLIEVDVRQVEHLPEGLRQPFTLIFRGPGQPQLAEELYTVDNDLIGSTELYIIPILTVGDWQDYQVVYN